MLRNLLLPLVSLAALMFSPFVQAAVQDARPESGDRVAIQAVINSQIQALQSQDAESAFALSAPDVRRQFGSADVFADMIREDYEPLLRHYSRMFLEILVEEEEVIQPVRIVSRDGSVVLALFGMQRQPDGEWKVYGCRLTPTGLHSA